MLPLPTGRGARWTGTQACGCCWWRTSTCSPTTWPTYSARSAPRRSGRPAGSVVHALQLLDRGGRIDAAILDVNLDGESVYPVADALRERGIPFVFSSGHAREALPDRFRDMPLVDKLVTIGHVRGALERLH